MKSCFGCICLLSLASAAAAASGLVGRWNFDEGAGTVAGDSSGHGRDAEIRGAGWVARGDGFALHVDDGGEHAACDSVPASLFEDGPVSVEAWVKPTVKGHGEAHLIGQGMGSFVLTYYNAELCYWYIGSGGNNLRGKLALHGWNHVVGAYDGESMAMWINGRQVGSKLSKEKGYTAGNGFHMGSSGGSDGPRFEGAMDTVRLYNRSLSAEEVVAHFKDEAEGYGYDPTWFHRLKVTPYYYLDRGEVVVEANYRGLQPLPEGARLEATLASRADPEQILERQVLDALPEGGEAEIRISSRDLVRGDYVIRIALRDGGEVPEEELTFAFPPGEAPLPAPASQVVGPLPAPPRPTPFTVTVDPAGGFTLRIKEADYPFQTRVSWPEGDFNVLGDTGGGEPEWEADVEAVDDSRYMVRARGRHYRIDRRIDVRPTHVYLRDTYTNTTDEDLGLLIHNEMPLAEDQVTSSRLGGFEGRLRASSTGSAEIFSPSVFVTDRNTGIGIVPIDDVFVVQCLLYADNDTPGVGTEQFALAPGDAYTLEWAVYPTGSRDYYDFVNAFRTAEGRIGRVDGGLGFMSYGPMNRRQVPDETFFANRGMKYGIIHCLSRAADDPEVSIEGIEFTDFPREMQLLKAQGAAFRRKHPGRKAMFHVAHSLYMTNDPERYADSKVILADGSHAVWGASEPYVSRKRMEEGWTWWIYYPTPGNSFHDALLRSVDVMMDELNMDGAFMDGFLAGYQGTLTYDGRWDGHSAEIDLQTKTITRKMGSVLLLSQPSMIEFARKIRDKGGVVVANNTMMTRSMANERYIIFDQEVASGPHLHFGPSVTALAQGPFANQKEMYLDMLDKLSWGELFVYYQDRIKLPGPSLAAFQFPMTFEEIRSGLVRGRDRIVTMNSGIYGWPGEVQLHQVHAFDARGVLVRNRFLTTVDAHGVRTRLDFGGNESAVIEPIPVHLEAAGPVNARVTAYDHSSLAVELHGQGEAALQMFVATTYPDKRDGVYTDGGMNPGVVGVGTPYRVTVDGETRVIEERDGLLSIPLALEGAVEVKVERERNAR